MDLDAINLSRAIPQYLTEDLKKGFLEALRSFPHFNYYLAYPDDTFLQGDGWTGLNIVTLSGVAEVRGVLLSNSCDIDPENVRLRSPRVVFAPVIAMRADSELLISAGKGVDKVAEQLDAIRLQKVTNVFYLPQGGGLEEESLVYLDDLYNSRLETFQSNARRKKLFTLSQVGFYLFVMKLSIHFCRFHENVLRDEINARTAGM